MTPVSLPATRDIVLVGGGHTHALVLRKWGMTPLPGARLTLINPGPTAPYSGMLPGHVAGHYPRDLLDIDLVRLARFAGARLVIGAADEINVADRVVHVPGRPPIGFDILSVDVGITSRMPSLPGFADHAVPAKPLGQFADAWARYLATDGPAHVAVLGGGVAGAELALAMAHALARQGRKAHVTLIDAARALQAVGAPARRRIRLAMRRLDVSLRETADVTRVASDHVGFSDGTRLQADFVVGAAGAKPYDWLSGTGLAQENGFLSVSATLQTSDPDIFAVGDCAHLAFDPRPKAGVYAVRQAPVLYRNLRGRATGAPLGRYRPQGDYLKLISLGEKDAVGERFGWTGSGPAIWRWKDSIDRTFMQQFSRLPRQTRPALPSVMAKGVRQALGPKPSCGGCGAKVGRTTLSAAIGAPDSDRTDLMPLPGDDAALIHMDGAKVILTTDHLRAFVDDPVLLARIAGIHALGDIWAMGATPQAATATLILPPLSDDLQARTLREIMDAARNELRQHGVEIVGGHTTLGTELTVGFSVTGRLDGEPITLAGARPDDMLLLTKPIGSGVIMAAEMMYRAPGQVVADALVHMLQGQGAAASILADAHAMTDVTGFGLWGHLDGMCTASGVGAMIDPMAVPLMKGALDLAQAGTRSSLYAANRAVQPGLPEDPRIDLLFDPQTAGGLLAAVPRRQGDALLTALRAAGYPAAHIGDVTENRGQIRLASDDKSSRDV